MQSIEVDQPFHRVGWTFEEKYDGWRMIAYKDGRHVQLISRAGKDHSHRFADLAAAIRTLPPARLILDGEVAIFDDKLVSRFEWFRKRPEDAVSTPPILTIRKRSRGPPETRAPSPSPLPLNRRLHPMAEQLEKVTPTPTLRSTRKRAQLPRGVN